MIFELRKRASKILEKEVGLFIQGQNLTDINPVPLLQTVLNISFLPDFVTIFIV